MTDPLALVPAFLYVVAILGIAEALRRRLGLSVEFTRKFVHVGVGMIAFPLVVLFHSSYWAVLPPLTFILVNYLSYRRGILSAMETGERGQLGTVYFPISFSILILLLWSRPALLVASLMPMTWGDAFAAILGRHYGRHPFLLVSRCRTVEGSLAMFFFSLVFTFLALTVFGLPANVSLALSTLTAVVATGVEALSPYGTDNLTVPLSSALTLVLAGNLAGT